MKHKDQEQWESGPWAFVNLLIQSNFSGHSMFTTVEVELSQRHFILPLMFYSPFLFNSWNFLLLFYLLYKLLPIWGHHFTLKVFKIYF